MIVHYQFDGDALCVRAIESEYGAWYVQRDGGELRGYARDSRSITPIRCERAP